MDELEASATLQTIQLLRASEGVNAEAEKELSDLEKALIALLALGLFGLFGKRKLNQLIKQANDLIDKTYKDIASNVSVAVESVAIAETKYVAVVAKSLDLPIARVLDAPLIVAKELLVQGATVDSWILKQNNALTFAIEAIARTAVATGENSETVAANIKVAIARSQKQVESIVKTAVLTAAGNAKVAEFKRMGGVTGMRQVSILDNRTSVVCVAYAGAEWDLDGNPLPGTVLPFNGGPPRHFNCRSTLIPLFAGKKSDKGKTVSANISDIIKSKPIKEVEAIMGKGRAEMFLAGKLTLTQLLDFRGNFLTLKQLHELYD